MFPFIDGSNFLLFDRIKKRKKKGRQIKIKKKRKNKGREKRKKRKDFIVGLVRFVLSPLFISLTIPLLFSFVPPPITSYTNVLLEC